MEARMINLISLVVVAAIAGGTVFLVGRPSEKKKVYQVDVYKGDALQATAMIRGPGKMDGLTYSFTIKEIVE